MRKLTKISLLIAIGTIILALLLLKNIYPDIMSLLNHHLTPEVLRAQVRSHGIVTALLLTTLLAVCCLIPGVPTSMVGVLIGVYFGPLVGIILNTLGTFTGNSLSYILISHFKIIEQPYTQNSWVRLIASAKHPAAILTVSYMIPFLPVFLVNYTADQLQLPESTTFLSILGGAIPSAVLLSFGGDALFRGQNKLGITLVLIFLLMGLLILVLHLDKKPALDHSLHG